MPWAFIIPAAATLLGASSQSRATQSAANTTASAANRAADLQYQQWREQVALQEPWRQAGVNALTKLQAASDYTPFGTQQFQADPGYNFRMSEGLKALDRQAAARGGLISGAALKAAQRYGQDLASQEYTNAFNRYQTERQARLGPLQSLAGVGQTATQQLGQAGQTMASNVGNIYGQQADTAANALLAKGSAYNRAFGDIGYLAGKYYGRQNWADVEDRSITSEG